MHGYTPPPRRWVRRKLQQSAVWTGELRVRRISSGIVPGICFMFVCMAVAPIHAATPITITFEDIFNKPFGFDSLPPFTWRGVQFSGGGLWRSATLGTWYEARNLNDIEILFPPGSTDISSDVDGRGGSNILFELMPLQVWQGSVGT